MKNLHRIFKDVDDRQYMIHVDYFIDESECLQINEVKTYPILDDFVIGSHVNESPTNITDKMYKDLFDMMRSDGLVFKSKLTSS